MERINIDLEVQNSIVPTAYNLARCKVSASLPSLQVNISDAKYKSLLRFIDVAVPHFDSDSSQLVSDPAHLRIEIPSNTRSANFPLSAGLFGQQETPYTIEDVDERIMEKTEEQFLEADEGSSDVSRGVYIQNLPTV